MASSSPEVGSSSGIEIRLNSILAHKDKSLESESRLSKGGVSAEIHPVETTSSETTSPPTYSSPSRTSNVSSAPPFLTKCLSKLLKGAKFIGPGFIIAVAYIDPGNYSTDVSAGAVTQFKLLFVVLMSNIFAMLLQYLAIRLGTITGMNLAEHCRAHLPRWLNICLYLLAEAAIIATDIAEVIGTAIALNLLFHIPIVAGCAISIVDVFLILLLYRSDGNLGRLRLFEFLVMALVLGVVICFCVELSYLTGVSVGDVFDGYVPSPTVVQGQGVYLSCGILGATVMPHSLYLGSELVQARLKDYDRENGTLALFEQRQADAPSPEKIHYRPSIAAIKYCLWTSVGELFISLCIFALFINSAILIVAGSALYNNADAATADLFGIHDLLVSTIGTVAGVIFALALLLSGTSAGIVCTIAGQIVSEGAIQWTIAPWMRRLLTRSLAIVPSIIVAGAIGPAGLNNALNGSQVALSVILPFVSAPLIYFTCLNRYMTVETETSVSESTSVANTDGVMSEHNAQDADADLANGGDGPSTVTKIPMRNHWLVAMFAVLVWLVIAVMNVALLVFAGMGDS